MIGLSWQMNYAGLSFLTPAQFHNLSCGEKPPVAGLKPAFICQDAQALATGGFAIMEQMKRCGKGDKCVHPDGPDLPINEFYKDKTRRDGLEYRCKACAQLYFKAYQQTPRYKEHYQTYNRSAASKTSRDTYEQTPKRKEQHRVYRLTHKSQAYRKGDQKKYKQAPKNKAYMKEYLKRYRQTQNGRMNAILGWQRRRSRELNLPTNFTNKDWERCLEYWDNRCAVCGRQATYTQDLFGSYCLAADHWIPMSSPECPGTIPANIVPLCHGMDGCNNHKSNHEPHTWLVNTFEARKATTIEKRIQRYFSWLKDKRS